jgi:hypothetical protein
VAPSIDRLKTPETHTSEPQHPSSDGKVKSYSDIVAGRKNDKKVNIIIRSKANHTPETIMELTKTKINPTEIKEGIGTFKVLKDGRILIEVGSKEEIKRISTSTTESAEKSLNQGSRIQKSKISNI